MQGDVQTEAHVGLAEIALVLALAALGSIAVPLSRALGWPAIGILGLPLALGVPGYLAIAIARLARIDKWERLALCVGLSLAADILLGLALNQTPVGLTAVSWVLSLDLIVACMVSVVIRERRAVRRRSAAKAEQSAAAHGASQSRGSRVRANVTVARVISTAFLLSAGGIAITAVAVARHGAVAQSRDDHFTQFWLVPTSKQPPGAPTTFTIGVANHESRPVKYSLHLTYGGKRIRTWPSLHIPNDGTWTHAVRVDTPQTETILVGSLTRADSTVRPYRYVKVWVRPSART